MTEIKVPGVCDIPDEVYFSHKALSRSSAYEYDKSPAKYKYFLDNPSKSKDSLALVEGSLVHCMTLEPEEVNKRFAYFSGARRAGADYNQAKMENKGKTIVTKSSWAKCADVANSVRSSKFYDKLIGNHEHKVEQAAFWQEPTSGLVCKAKADVVRDDFVLVDLKTTKDASIFFHADGSVNWWKGFPKSCVDWGYLMQAAWYLDGFTYATDFPHDDFYFIAVEKEPPYLVTSFKVDTPIIARERAKYQHVLERYKESVKTDTWPGYADEIVLLTEPKKDD